jgi:hypothetical protein
MCSVCAMLPELFGNTASSASTRIAHALHELCQEVMAQ